MCPSSTWFGRITIGIGFLLLLLGKTPLLEGLGYVFIATSFIYSIFFTDKSCSVEDAKKSGDN